MRVVLIAASITLGMLAPAVAQTQPQISPDQRRALASACRSDVEKLCPGIQPGGGRIAICMRGKIDQASAGCREAMAKVRAAR
jgi:hypothetical protein